MKKENKWAFSLVEMMVALIAIACIAASVTPIVTKKITGRKLNLSTNLVNLTIDCEEKFGPECKLCEKTKRCLLCDKQCPEGTYIDTATCSCIPCNTIDANCKLCQRGAQCTQCQAGYYLKDNKCHPCNPGNKCDGNNEIDCTQGYYQDEPAQPSCKECDLGSASNDIERDTSCTLCTPGHYQDTKKQPSCKECDLGSASNETGRKTSCTLCTPGHYQDTKGQPSCKQCSKGTASNETGRETACPQCETGYCQKEAGKSSCNLCSLYVANCIECNRETCGCTKCKPGYYLINGSCKKCSPGYTCDGSPTQTICPAGTYNSGEGNTDCKDCEAGYYCPGGSGHGDCWTKDAHYSHAKASSCSACGAGTYATDASGNWSGNYRGTTCLTCPAGWKCNGTPVACGAGTCQKDTGKSSCKDCSSVVANCSNCNATTCACSGCGTNYVYKDGKCCSQVNDCESYNADCTCSKCKAGYIKDGNSCTAGQTYCNNISANLLYVSNAITGVGDYCITRKNVAGSQGYDAGNYGGVSTSWPQNNGNTIVLKNVSVGTTVTSDLDWTCWYGTTGGNNCDSINNNSNLPGGYGGCRRVVCRQMTAAALCNHMTLGGRSWTLINRAVANKIMENSSITQSLYFCSGTTKRSGYTHCHYNSGGCTSKNGSTTHGKNCMPARIWLYNDQGDVLNRPMLIFSDPNSPSISNQNRHQGASTRCMTKIQ